MTEGLDMKFKGFTLIELMVVLAIIVIIATASVPKIQEWTARNRGNQAVSQLISDFTKARSIAGYTVNDTNQPIGVRPQIGLMLGSTRYFILQKDAMSGSWSNISDTTIKAARLPMNVAINNVNGEATNDGSTSTTIVFTSSGKVKNGATNGLVDYLTHSMKCGSGASAVDSPINTKRVFVATVRSMINSKDGIYYRIEMDATGEYFVCACPHTSNDPPNDAPNFDDKAEANVINF